MNKAIIFDIDGTLVDTRLGIKTSVDYVVNKFNLKPLTEQEFIKFISYSPISASFSNIYNIDTALANQYGEEYTKKYKEDGICKAKLYDGILDLLSILKDNNYKLGIATFKNEANAIKLLSNLNIHKYFDCICGNTNTANITKTDILYNCLNKLNAIKSDSIFIGDTSTDAIAAKNLNIDFIGVLYGFGLKTEQEIQNYKHIFISKNSRDLVKYFRSK